MIPHSLADVPDEFPPTNPVEKPEVGPVDEFPDGGRGIAHQSPETRMDRRGPGGAGVDEINRNILALDLGTHTGFALRRRDGTIVHGTENFTPRANWSPGQRWLRFRSWLVSTIVQAQIHVIAYEQVIQGGWAGNREHAGHKSGAAGDAYGGFKALLEMAAASHNIVLYPVHVATVKKHWTGDGRAKKPDMIAEARRRGFRPDSDNAADALAILDWAVARETGTWKPAPKRPKAKKTSTRGRQASPSAPDLFGVR
jgi:hypothetical protein